MMSELNLLLHRCDHIIPEVVKSELRICTVNNFGHICPPSIRVAGIMLKKPNVQAQKSIDGSHPFTIPFCQIIIYSDQMNPIPGKRIQINGKCGYQCLSLSGRHLSYFPFMQYYSTHDLDVKMPHVQRSFRNFSHN